MYIAPGNVIGQTLLTKEVSYLNEAHSFISQKTFIHNYTSDNHTTHHKGEVYTIIVGIIINDHYNSL